MDKEPADPTDRPAGPKNLTKREKQVVCLVGQCMSNRKIGEVIGCETSTVKTFLEHIRNKLHLHKKSEVARFAWENGLQPPECRYCKPSECPFRHQFVNPPNGGL